MLQPTIKTETSDDERYVTVVFRFSAETSEMVTIRFLDPQKPVETNRAEWDRLIARARELAGQIASPAP